MAIDMLGDQKFSAPPKYAGALTEKEMAVGALQELTKTGYALSTSELRKRLGLQKTDQIRLRKAMGRLVNTGVVEIQPGGSNKWIIVQEYKYSWTADDPFKKMKGTAVQPIPQNFGNVDLDNYVPKSDYENLAKASVETIEKLQEEKKALASERDDLEKKLAKAGEQVIVIKHPDGTKVKIKDKVMPEKFQRIMELAGCRRNILLVGPAGCGKTHVAEEVALALGLDFEAVSCTAGMSEAHLTGRSRPKLQGKDIFLSTGFLKCYEEGGVFLFDEFDAADPNLLLVVNTALANGYCSVPNRDLDMVAKKHKDFVCIATANTIGRGATRMYQGRNQLDAATLDRFQIGMIEMDYDLNVEEAIIQALESTMKNGKGDSLFGPTRKYNPVTDKSQSKVTQVIDHLVSKQYDMLETLWYIRDRINAAQGLRRIMSTRFIQDAGIMMAQGGWDHYKVLEAYFCGWSNEEVAKMM